MFRKYCLRTAGVKEYIKKQTVLWQTFYYDKEQSALVNFSAQKIAPPYCVVQYSSTSYPLYVVLLLIYCMIWSYKDWQAIQDSEKRMVLLENLTKRENPCSHVDKKKV